MRFLSQSNPDKEYSPQESLPSFGNGLEYQRLLYVFYLTIDAVRNKRFTSRHTVNCGDIKFLEQRFFGTSNERYLGTEESIKRLGLHDGAPDIVMFQNGFALAIDHFCFDCAKWTKKGSPLQAMFSNQRGLVENLSREKFADYIESHGIACSAKSSIENIRRLISNKAEKASSYYTAIDEYLMQGDRHHQKELWLLAEDVFPVCSIDAIVDEVLRLFVAYPGLAGLIYVRDNPPFFPSKSIDDVRYIFNDKRAVQGK